MKPLNLDNRPCSPISSNCVIWQGPTLGCIDLCTGDTISDVIAKLAEELCTLLDQTNVTNYDLTCLGITACGPKDFQALIQLLIDKICELNNIPQETTKSANTCPDCIVTVAPCFQTGNATTMQLLDYVQMIAQKVCALIDQIGELQTQITNLDNRVTVLENTPPPTFTIPSIIVDCTLADGTVIGGNSYPIDIVLNALVNDDDYGYCALIDATGLPTELLAAIGTVCITSTTPTLSDPTKTFGELYGPYTGYGTWQNSPTTVADTINNMWIVLCDTYDAINNFSLNVQDTNSIDLTYSGGIISANIVDTGWEPLEGFDHMPLANRPQCRRIGNQIHFRGVVVIPLETPGNPSSYVPWSTTSYNSIFSPTVYSGSGGVYVNSNGSIIFNQQNSVIPTSIVDSLTNFDNTYGMGYIIATRQIDLNSTGIKYGTALSAVVSVGITNTKHLYVAVLKDLEYTSTAQQTDQYGSSHLRYITSNVTEGEEVPVYTNAATTIHSSPNTSTTNAITLPAPLAPDTQYINNLTVNYNPTGALPTYPFSCDAGDENQIGGFAFRLDGLIAYLDPCNTDIKSYACK